MLKVLVSVIFFRFVVFIPTITCDDGPDIDFGTIINDLAMVPDINGIFYQINITQKQIEYAQARRSDYSVDFFVLTRQYSVTGNRLIVGDTSSLRNSNFNPRHPTRIIAHGWMGSRNSLINKAIPDAYFQRGDYNIILVDWSDASQTIDYFASCRSIPQVGSRITTLINFLKSHAGTDPRSIYMIGHSLGAHLMGVAARQVESGRIGVIIALDAALPLFTPENKDRLLTSDADYVLSIHTNGGRFGVYDPIGHASFYPNYGKQQPGCGFEPFMGCSHGRCVDYFAESIMEEHNSFISQRCDSFDEIVNKKCLHESETAYLGGDPINTSFNGIFYVRTNPRQPFGMGVE